MCHLPGFNQVGHSPLGNQRVGWSPELGLNVVGSSVPPSPNFPLHLFLLDGRKRVGHWGSWWLIHSVTSGAWKVLGKVPSDGWWVPHALGLSRICLPISFLPSPPSKCGTCPFTLYSGLISKISFCLVHFGHFDNHPPDPERYFVNLTCWYTTVGTEGLSICHSMPHAVTPPGLPGRRGVFSCWCKWTSGLGVPSLRSHYSTFFCPALSCNYVSRSLISTKLVIGMGNEYGKYSPYTYLPGGYLWHDL